MDTSGKTVLCNTQVSRLILTVTFPYIAMPRRVLRPDKYISSCLQSCVTLRRRFI